MPTKSRKVLRKLALAAACVMVAAPAVAATPPTAIAVYVALFDSNAVSIYRGINGRTPTGRITVGVYQPVALATDAANTLYVLNGNSTVTIYPEGSTTPTATYSQGIATGTYLAVGPDASLYVASINDATATNTVVQFPPGSPTPSRTLTFSTLVGGITVDKAGNLFVVLGLCASAGGDVAAASGTCDIEQFAPGSTTGTSLGFALTNSPGGLGLDAEGNFAVNEASAAVVVLAKAPPHAQLHNFSFPATSPSGFAFGRDGKSLYLTDSTEGRVVRIVYPQGNFANVIDDAYGGRGAIAVSPPLTN